MFMTLEANDNGGDFSSAFGHRESGPDQGSLLVLACYLPHLIWEGGEEALDTNGITLLSSCAELVFP
jgi:hypothetical protein